ncbi:hypothetical protein [Clavibacter michiganensis]|uniref:hypothetical protein n=1 Tax=Clavibacter michiganensis TaxID=28447 RepID=UPI000A3C4CDD|nr:hypothetical protein [Clavibacter michiganensis]MDO4099556.1 hypothetical protein [Clavibacter michiganensis]MDO4126972.1 hypothetical protein [Clavibacter michiganensis]NIY60812.1 hypothetical protein [Clavibacter michiganensis subsp. michiganensis]OUE29026.1 hypothetical protein CMMCA001_01180 [Clavibacter michiganensis subsp. michiganensis]QXP01853.1 hypothetical protein KN218_09645 [Clavibacter michiganensis subsp. michiganensis]
MTPTNGTAPPTHGRWRRARRRLGDAPAVVPAMGVAVAWSGILTCSRVALGQEADLDRIVATLTVGAVVGLILTFAISRRPRGAPPRIRFVDVSETIDDGQVPADADADSWRWLLLRRREVHDQLGGPWAVLIAAVALGGTVAVGALGGPPLAWTLPAVIAVIVAGMAVARRRRVAQIDALLQPLLDADATGGIDAADGAGRADHAEPDPSPAAGPARRPPT